MKRIGYIHAPRVKGNLNLGLGAWMAAPAGIIGAFNTMGDVFFADLFNGNNAWDGSLPEREAGTLHGPFQTIAYALTQCAHDHDDYIVVLNGWNEATPIAINKRKVHLIGLSNNPINPYITLTATGDTAVFTLSSSCNDAEIAGFSFGGGATHGGIENTGGTPMGVHIHDCVFGHFFSGNTPAYGINIALNATAMCIEDCIFLGTGNNSRGTITIDGIRWETGAINYNGLIRNNIFMGLPGIAINISARGDGLAIIDNIIALDANTAGAGITLGATSLGCLVARNSANYGDTAMAASPYVDGAAGGANTWIANQGGGGGLANTPWALPT